MKRTCFVVRLENRTAEFGLRTLLMLRELPTGVEFKGIRRQLTYSATAIGSRYREAVRATAWRDVLERIAAARTAVAETEYWLVLIEGLLPDLPGISVIHEESVALLKVFDRLQRVLAHRYRAGDGDGAPPDAV